MRKLGKKKLRFELQDHETVDELLNRMKKEGYVPVGKYEKPIFKEIKHSDGTVQYEPVKKQIIFEGKLIDEK